MSYEPPIHDPRHDEDYSRKQAEGNSPTSTGPAFGPESQVWKDFSLKFETVEGFTPNRCDKQASHLFQYYVAGSWNEYFKQIIEKSKDGGAVSELPISDMFGDDCSEIVIRLQMLAYPDDKKRFEGFLMDKLKAMLEEEGSDKVFDTHKLVAARYNVELRHVKLSSNTD